MKNTQEQVAAMSGDETAEKQTNKYLYSFEQEKKKL